MDTAPALLAKHFRDVHFGGNWTVSDLRTHLTDVTWEEATHQVADLNTIARLTFHMNYFVCVAMRVLEGGPLDGHDKFSFDHPPITSAADWDALRSKALADAERFSALVEQLPEGRSLEPFVNEKYGTYYRNIQGITEHTHYHLGQLVVIKKLVRAGY